MLYQLCKEPSPKIVPINLLLSVFCMPRSPKIYCADASARTRATPSFSNRHHRQQAKPYQNLPLALRAGTNELAQLVRKDQDLTAEADRLDKSIIAAVSKPPAERNHGGGRPDTKAHRRNKGQNATSYRMSSISGFLIMWRYRNRSPLRSSRHRCCLPMTKR